MAIVKMQKFTLLFPEDKKEELLGELQRFEKVHFKPLDVTDELNFMTKDAPSLDDTGIVNEMAKVRFALSKLEPHEKKPTGLAALKAPTPTIDYKAFSDYEKSFDYAKICSSVKELDEKINECRLETARLKAVIDELKPWSKLDVSVGELGQLRYTDYTIGLVGASSFDQLVTAVDSEFSETYIEPLGQLKEDIIILVMFPRVISEDVKTRLKMLGFSKINPSFDGIPEKLTADYTAKLEEIQKGEESALASLKALATSCSSLRVLLDLYETRTAKAEATRNFLKIRTTVLCEGWMPEGEEDKFDSAVHKACGDAFYYELSEVEKDDEEVPIKLKNNKLLSPFESIIEMYAMPKYGEIDPTGVVAPFYTIFFGLMVGDIAYGLIMVLASIFALTSLNLKEGTRRFISFFLIAGFGTIFGGIIYGGFFGYTVFTPIRLADGSYKAILDTTTDIVTMLGASVAAGIFHVLFGIAVKGYMLIRDNKPIDALFDSGFWIVTLLGGIGYLLDLSGMLPAPFGFYCKWAFILGIIGLACTQGRSAPTLGGKAGSGLYAVYGISSYVGDFVSYTRIAALALSGAYIAYAFNMMIDMLPGISRIIVGMFIFAIGQSLNFGLAALGAYVHTCRLMYVEYFGKFYEGGGKPYKPFKLVNNFINVEK